MSDAFDEETIEIQPRPLREVVGRAAVLTALTRRGMLEVESNRDPYELETDRFDLAAWVHADLDGWVEAHELRPLARPVGEMEPDDLAACEDALASLSTIAWTIGAIPYDSLPLMMTSEETEMLLQWAPQPWANLDQLQRRAEMKSETILATERERWELWHWRAIEVVDASEEMPDVLEEVAESGLIPVSGHDLATSEGIPFQDLADDEQEEIAWLAGLRLSALNWVCGFGTSWAEVPLYPD